MMSNPKLITPFDAFKDAEAQDNSIIKGYINLRLFQHSKNSRTTIVEGLPYDILDVEKILKEWCRKFKCSGNIADGKTNKDKIVKIQGDQRELIKQFLIEEDIATEKQIRILN